MRDDLHLSGNGAAVFSENLVRSMDSGTGYKVLVKLDSWVGTKEKPNTEGINKDSTKKSAKNSLENSSECGYTCICLNARSIVNKRNELSLW